MPHSNGDAMDDEEPDFIRDGDPEFRSLTRNHRVLAMVRCESSKVMDYLCESGVVGEPPTSILNLKVPKVGEPWTFFFAFRLTGSDWIQFDCDDDFTHPLTVGLMGISKAIKTSVYLSVESDSGFSYSLEESGKTIEEYGRDEEPIYEYIPKHARRTGTKVRKDRCEYLWVKGGVEDFDKLKGVKDDHEVSLLQSLQCNPIAVSWRHDKHGVYRPSTGYSLDDFSELYRFEVRKRSA